MLGLNMFIYTISVLKVLCENGLSPDAHQLIGNTKSNWPTSRSTLSFIAKKCIRTAISILHFNISKKKVNHTIPYVQGEIWMKIHLRPKIIITYLLETLRIQGKRTGNNLQIS